MRKAKADKPQVTPDGKMLGGCTGKGFLPGVSGNPRGRSRMLDARQITREIGETYDPKMGKTRDQHFWELVYRRACQGDSDARKLWASYRHGTPAQLVLNADVTNSLSPEEETEQVQELLACLPETDEKPSKVRVN